MLSGTRNAKRLLRKFFLTHQRLRHRVISNETIQAMLLEIGLTLVQSAGRKL
jgi:hypothetical protein